MRKTLTRAALAALVLAALARPEGVPAQDVAAAAAPAAAGAWTLNPALSDDPEEQLANVRGAQPPPAVRRSGSEPAGATPFDPVRRAIEAFQISFTDTTVVLAYPDRELELTTDGREQEVRLDDERTAEYRARWDDTALLVERNLDGGIRLTERYSVHEGTGRLHVLTRLEGDRLPRTIAFMRVYDRDGSAR
jgi:hypothetical protein